MTDWIVQNMHEHREKKEEDLGKRLYPSKVQNIIVFFISGLFVLALLSNILLNVSRIEFEIDPPIMFPDGSSTSTIKAIPYNKLGTPIPVKKLNVYFEITEGSDIVEIVAVAKNSITLRAKHETGDVRIRARLSEIVFPYEMVVPIVPQFALKYSENLFLDG